MNRILEILQRYQESLALSQPQRFRVFRRAKYYEDTLAGLMADILRAVEAERAEAEANNDAREFHDGLSAAMQRLGFGACQCDGCRKRWEQAS